MEHVIWKEDAEKSGVWECDATHLISHDYGGTHARTGVYRRDADGAWRRIRVGSVRHGGERELIDAGIAEAVGWIHATHPSPMRVRLGVGCKGPTDTQSGWTNPSDHFAWEPHNVLDYYRSKHPDAFDEAIAVNDLLAGAFGAALSSDVRRQLEEATEFLPPERRENLWRDVAVLSCGTGAGYKVIHADGSVGEGGEIWTLYAPVETTFLNWLWERWEQECSKPNGSPDAYAPHVEAFVSGSGLPIFYEYLLAHGRSPSPQTRHAVESAADISRALSEQAHAGCPVCLEVFTYLAAHLAALCQQIVQAHKPRSLVLSGASLIARNWDLLREPFFRYFHREWGDAPVEFPQVRHSRIGLVSWARETAVAIDRSAYPGLDGAAYLASQAEFYRGRR